MSNRIVRLLMLVLFVALQAMTPFIHAHAAPPAPGSGEITGSRAQPGAAVEGFLHIHARAHLDPACQSDAVPDTSAEVDVPTGIEARTPAGAERPSIHVSPLTPVTPTSAADHDRGTPRPAAVVAGWTSPCYRLPPAFAPPAA